MKKILASLMMVGLYFLSWWMQRSMDETKAEKTKAAKVIQADKVEGTMKGIEIKGWCIE